MGIPTITAADAQAFTEAMDDHTVPDEFGYRKVTVCSLYIGKLYAKLVYSYDSKLWSAWIWYPEGSAAVTQKGFEEANELYATYAQKIIDMSKG